MIISCCLFVKAPKTVRTLNSSNITVRIKEAVGVAVPVALEEGQIRPLLHLELFCEINMIGNGRTSKAIRLGLFVLSNQFGQWR